MPEMIDILGALGHGLKAGVGAYTEEDDRQRKIAELMRKRQLEDEDRSLDRAVKLHSLGQGLASNENYQAAWELKEPMYEALRGGGINLAGPRTVEDTHAPGYWQREQPQNLVRGLYGVPQPKPIEASGGTTFLPSSFLRGQKTPYTVPYQVNPNTTATNQTRYDVAQLQAAIRQAGYDEAMQRQILALSGRMDLAQYNQGQQNQRFTQGQEGQNTRQQNALDARYPYNWPAGIRKWEPKIQRQAAGYGLPPELVRGVMMAESGGEDLTSPVGARGPMQLMPGTARDLGANPNNPDANLIGGVKYLSQLYRKYNGDLNKTIAAYNAGPGAVDKYRGIPPFAETQAYVKRVRNFMTKRGPFDQVQKQSFTPFAGQDASGAPVGYTFNRQTGEYTPATGPGGAPVTPYRHPPTAAAPAVVPGEGGYYFVNRATGEVTPVQAPGGGGQLQQPPPKPTAPKALDEKNAMVRAILELGTDQDLVVYKAIGAPPKGPNAQRIKERALELMSPGAKSSSPLSEAVEEIRANRGKPR